MFELFGGDAGPVHEGLEQMGKHGFGKPPESQACQRDAELGRAEGGVEILNEFQADRSAPVALVDQGDQLRVADLDDGELGGDEEPVEQDEPDDQDEPDGEIDDVISGHGFRG